MPVDDATNTKLNRSKLGAYDRAQLFFLLRLERFLRLRHYWLEAMPRTDEECHMFNRFLLKLGWRDERSAVLPQRIHDAGLAGKPIETIIDHIEYDEGRDPVADRAWDGI